MTVATVIVLHKEGYWIQAQCIMHGMNQMSYSNESQELSSGANPLTPVQRWTDKFGHILPSTLNERSTMGAWTVVWNRCKLPHTAEHLRQQTGIEYIYSSLTVLNAVFQKHMFNRLKLTLNYSCVALLSWSCVTIGLGNAFAPTTSDILVRVFGWWVVVEYISRV